MNKLLVNHMAYNLLWDLNQA